MLNTQECSTYNEVVVAAQDWSRGLPATIEGIFFAAEESRQKAREVHSTFLQHFNLTRGDQTPLLQLLWGDPQPFRDVTWDSMN